MPDRQRLNAVLGYASQAKATREEARKGRVAVLSSDGRLVAARGCVHMQTAPRALVRR